MLLRELLSRLRLMPDQCRVQVAVPVEGGSIRLLPLVQALPDSDDRAAPLSLRAGDGEALSLTDIRDMLEEHDPGAMVRVAVDHDADHHRMLDIEMIGFGAAGDDETPPVELRTEPENALVMIIRQRAL